MARKKRAAKKAAPAQRVLGTDEYVITLDQLNELRDIITDCNSVVSSKLRSAVEGETDSAVIGFHLGRVDGFLDQLVERGEKILDSLIPEEESDDDDWSFSDDDNG